MITAYGDAEALRRALENGAEALTDQTHPLERRSASDIFAGVAGSPVSAQAV